ncbi:MAG: PocR ligand-binding domain-containing protein, partial [Oscillospiraceae bacterium]|nr:PocR ligand-binding domain-containing protein [Oscillospiraceae bacterium]
MEAENVYLTDIIDLDVLQKIQDAFSSMTDMACIITDAYGVAVSSGSNFCDFCSRFTRVSPEGARRCEECDKRGAEMAIENKGVCTYFCHAGLIEFAAPIMANGQMVGSIVGGQILSAPPDLNAFAEKAKELGIDPDDYTHEAKKVRILAQKEIDKAALSLNSLAEVLSTVATNNFNMLANSAEVEKSAKLKSDFLANMSHEIRTPMNAVLGMAEMALREEMSPTARDFIHQIRASGKNLLTIINDILDFSKIESGKMEIIEVPYEPLSMINDIASMVNSRIGDKNIEFTVDAPPEIPHKLFGDNVRIQQILINLLTNAVKFTKQGQVQLRLKFRKKNENEGTLKALVMDTGMGIKEENLDKIFESFQQVDSKRNRNIEGTGLGLAITQQLLTLMGGFIDVESEYNVGSTFAIIIPQKIVSKEPSVPKSDKTVSAAVISQNMYICMQLVKDLSRLNATYAVLEKENYMDALDFDFLFIEENLFTKEIQTFVTNNQKLQCIVIENRKSLKRFNVVNIRTIRKPIYVLSLYSILGIGEDYAAFADFMDDDFPFTAPDAQILIVDDNTINLTVAEGLLEPLNMKIDTATGAKDAINKIKEKKFDLIFMDHMMPEIDGVEATHMIRTTFPDYEDTPIIALTANAVANAKDMFLSEGLNDFVAKPIEIKDIVSKLKKWLPHEKIVIAEAQHEEKQEDELGPFYKEVEVESETYPDESSIETTAEENTAEAEPLSDASPDQAEAPAAEPQDNSAP